MRKFLLAGLCLFFSSSGLLLAQNKTLGVGVTTPNPNAALHVESPTNNQGIIMPRLTTAQRVAMASLLTASDKGLMLYDTDRAAMFIWDGGVWKSSSDFSVMDTTNTTSVINVLNKGLGNAGKFQNQNRRSKTPALWAETNSDSALSAPIYGLNTGTGDVAGSFKQANPATKFPALYGESLGTGGVARFISNGTGGTTVFAQVNNTGHAYWAQHEGTAGYAAILQSVNPANPSPAVFVEAVGTGFSLFVQKSLPESTGDVILSEHAGTSGHAGRFVINNTANPSVGVLTTTNGQGAAIQAENNGAADGIAGLFMTTDAANTYPAIQASTAGVGPGLRVMQQTGPGSGIDINMMNTSSTAVGISVGVDGLGTAGNFLINNSTNTATALSATTNGTGSAIAAQTASGWTAFHARRDGIDGNAAVIEVSDPNNNYPALQANTAGTGFAINARHTGTAGDAIYAEHSGAGSGSAGNFRISNASNSASAVYAATNAPGGNAMSVSNDANGIAFTIWNGGLQVTTNEVTTGTSLTTRASAYRITSTTGTNFTIDFGPVAGEVFMIFNDTAGTITIAAAGGNVSLLAGEGKTFIAFSPSVIRAL